MKVPSVRFRIRKDAAIKKDIIYCFIRYGGIEAPKFSTNIEAKSAFNQPKQQFSGYSDDAIECNNMLDEIKRDIHGIYSDLSRNGEIITAFELKRLYLAKKSGKLKSHLLHCLYRDYVSQVIDERKLSHKTADKWNKSIEHLKEFLDSNGISNIDVRSVKIKTIKLYYRWMRNTKKTSIGHSKRHIQYLKGAFSKWEEDEIVDKNILNVWKCSEVQTKKKIFALTEKDVTRIYNTIHQYRWTKAEEDAIRIFVFMCYTGFDYCDIEDFNQLGMKNLKIIEGHKVLVKPRRKNEGYSHRKESTIFLFPIALDILNYYDWKFPIYTNQHYNAVIKIAGKNAKIENYQKITCKTARRTAATILVNNGLDLKYVKEFLGHQSITTTELFYADMKTYTVVKEMSQISIGKYSKLKAV